MSENKSLSLQFSSRVLWVDAAHELKEGRVTQTIRSRKAAYPFFTKRGCTVNIMLDGEVLYEARITDLVAVENLASVTSTDALSGGFDTVDELRSALMRAGFRFKPLYSYGGFKIQFQKVSKNE